VSYKMTINTGQRGKTEHMDSDDLQDDSECWPNKMKHMDNGVL
jgi:hypothetical protein